MDTKELVTINKWITNISLVLFVAFSYFYYAQVGSLQKDVNDMNEQIERDQATIDNTTNNATKIQLIKSSLAKAENMHRRSVDLMIYRMVAIIFIVIGLAGMIFGFNNVRKIAFPATQKKE